MKFVLFIFFVASCSWVPERKQEPIRRVTRTRTDDYRTCVKNSQTYKLNRLNQKRWRIIAEYTIQPDGKVTNASITNSDFEESALHKCILDELSGLTFPSPEKGTKVVRQMMDLNPGEGK